MCSCGSGKDLYQVIRGNRLWSLKSVWIFEFQSVNSGSNFLMQQKVITDFAGQTLPCTTKGSCHQLPKQNIQSLTIISQTVSLKKVHTIHSILLTPNLLTDRSSGIRGMLELRDKSCWVLQLASGNGWPSLRRGRSGRAVTLK